MDLQAITLIKLAIAGGLALLSYYKSASFQKRKQQRHLAHQLSKIVQISDSSLPSASSKQNQQQMHPQADNLRMEELQEQYKGLRLEEEDRVPLLRLNKNIQIQSNFQQKQLKAPAETPRSQQSTTVTGVSFMNESFNGGILPHKKQQAPEQGEKNFSFFSKAKKQQEDSRSEFRRKKMIHKDGKKSAQTSRP